MRACKQWAAENEVEVGDEDIFTDEAQSGRRRHREGYGRMMAAMNSGKIDVLICLSTSRLHRKVHRILQFIDEQILPRRRRFVAVQNRIDTNDGERTKLLMTLHGLMDEMLLSATAGHVKEALVGMAMRGEVHGVLPFGYCGNVIEGQLTKLGKPRMQIEPHPEYGERVRDIFEWFLKSRMGFRAIARRLRDEGVPPPDQAERWTGTTVRRMLSNRRYIGDWSYGVHEGIWQGERDYSKPVKREKPLQLIVHEHLRLIEDATFGAVQARLSQRINQGGRPSHRGPARVDPLLSVSWCPTHQCRLTAGGPRGTLGLCPKCKRIESNDEQPLFSGINRAFGNRLLLKTLAGLIQTDQGFCDELATAVQMAVVRMQQPDPAHRQQLSTRLDRLQQRIDFILESPGESESDRAENKQHLMELRRERQQIQADLEALSSAAKPMVVPTAEQICEKLTQLESVLLRAMRSNDADDHGDVLAAIHQLTGGRIEMIQQGPRRAKRGWLRGTFQLQMLHAVVDDPRRVVDSAVPTLITLDFRQPTLAEEIADPAKALFDEGVLIKEIARRLSTDLGRRIDRNLVRRALAHWFSSRGLSQPDGRSRRSDLEHHTLEPPLYKRIAPQVMQSVDEGVAYGQIATTLGVDAATITAAVQYGHQQRGVPAPDGRTRRRLLREANETQGQSPSA